MWKDIKEILFDFLKGFRWYEGVKILVSMESKSF